MRKNLIIMLALIVMPYYLTAQENTQKIHELGLNFAGLSAYGIRYRTGTENTKLRLTLLSIDGSTSKYKSDTAVISTSNSAGLAFNIGFEKSRNLSDNLSFYCGMDLLTSFSGGNSTFDPASSDRKFRTMSAGAGVVLGFAYKFNNDISITTEVVPSVIYSYTKNTNTTAGEESVDKSSGFQYGLGAVGANLTLSFRIGKKN